MYAANSTAQAVALVNTLKHVCMAPCVNLCTLVCASAYVPMVLPTGGADVH